MLVSILRRLTFVRVRGIYRVSIARARRKPGSFLAFRRFRAGAADDVTQGFVDQGPGGYAPYPGSDTAPPDAYQAPPFTDQSTIPASTGPAGDLGVPASANEKPYQPPGY